jgi:hypothetical protein
METGHRLHHGRRLLRHLCRRFGFGKQGGVGSEVRGGGKLAAGALDGGDALFNMGVTHGERQLQLPNIGAGKRPPLGLLTRPHRPGQLFEAFANAGVHREGHAHAQLLQPRGPSGVGATGWPSGRIAHAGLGPTRAATGAFPRKAFHRIRNGRRVVNGGPSKRTLARPTLHHHVGGVEYQWRFGIALGEHGHQMQRLKRRGRT